MNGPEASGSVQCDVDRLRRGHGDDDKGDSLDVGRTGSLAGIL